MSYQDRRNVCVLHSNMNKENKESKESTPKDVKSCLTGADALCFDKCIRLDLGSQLLNPDVHILKLADNFDNTLLFDGKDEFWITNCNQPVWRSNYADRYASYEEVVKVWNLQYPKHPIDLSWFKNILKKMFEPAKGCSCNHPHCKCSKKVDIEVEKKDKKEEKKDKKENKEKKEVKKKPK